MQIHSIFNPALQSNFLNLNNPKKSLDMTPLLLKIGTVFVSYLIGIGVFMSKLKNPLFLASLTPLQAAVLIGGSIYLIVPLIGELCGRIIANRKPKES